MARPSSAQFKALRLAVVMLLAMAVAPLQVFAARTPAGRSSADTASSARATVGVTFGDYVSGEVLVRFRANTPPASKAAACALVGAARARRIASVPGLELVRLAPGVSVERAVAALSGLSSVAHAQPNYIKRLATIPDDPLFSGQWGLENAGNPPDADIDAPAAWDSATGSSEVTVAVVDTGIAYEHPDLDDNVWVNTAEAAGTPGVDDDGNGWVDDIHGYDFINGDGDPNDDHGHGTHVAGTIAAETNNGVGVAGVTWDASLMALKVFDAHGTTTTDAILDAFAYADAMGVRILNNSWGGGDFDQLEHDAIASMSDSLFVFAAGNGWGNDNDANPHYPSSYDLDNILAVGATDSADDPADFSNVGATSVDVFAPGDDILSTTLGRNVAFSDPLADLSNWSVSSNNGRDWMLDSVDYTSAPTSAAIRGYANSQVSYMDLTTPIDISAGVGPALVFDAWWDLEGGYDFFSVWVSTDPSGGWSRLDSWSGSSSGWQDDLTVPIPAGMAGASTLYVRFEMTSDSSVTFTGCGVDDVRVELGGSGSDYTSSYGLMSGTSMAAPHVTGIAALLAGYAPTHTIVDLKRDIMDGVDVKYSLDGLCVTSGRVNAYTALLNAGAAATRGAITGAVTDTAGDRADGVMANGFRWDQGASAWMWVATDKPGATGDYALTALESGRYAVGFSDETGPYIEQFYDGVMTADPARGTQVDVLAGQTVSGIDAVMEEYGSIVGRITDTEGRPLSDIEVELVVYDEDFGAWTWSDVTSTDLDGEYGFGWVLPTTYRAIFFDRDGAFAVEWYEDTVSFSEAADIVVGSGEVVTVDAELEDAGVITGTVTDPDGYPIEGAVVWAFWEEPALDGFPAWTPVETDHTGRYEIRGLGTKSDYRVGFAGGGILGSPAPDASDGGDFCPESYDNRSEVTMPFTSAAAGIPATAETPPDDVSVTAGEITGGIDATLGWWWDEEAPAVYSDAVDSYLDEAVIEITGEDDTGVEEIFYRLDGAGPVRVKGASTTVTVAAGLPAPTPTANGTEHELVYWSVDFCAKPSEPETVTFTISAADRDVPTITDDAVATYLDKAVITLTATDDTELASISYRLDDEPTVTIAATGVKAAVLVETAQPGKHTLAYWATDASFNVSAVGSASFEVLTDESAPVVTDDAEESYIGTAVITLTATDDRGVAAIYYDLDGGADFTEVDGDTAVVTVTEVGAHTLTYWAQDVVGNAGAVAVVEFTVLPDIPEGVSRVAGSDRYLTAIKASQTAFSGGAETVVLATGENWPDALSGAALAGAANAPLLLSHAAALDEAVAAEIERLGAERAYILGGVGALAPAVEASLEAMLGADDVERLAGRDRYATSRAVAEETIKVAGDRFDGSAFVATGADFPDALAASPVAGAACMPVLLASPAATEFLLPAAVTDTVILGGTAAVAPVIETALKADLGDDDVTRIGGLNRYETAALVSAAGAERFGSSFRVVGLATGESYADALSGGAMLAVFRGLLLLTPSDSLHPSTDAAFEDNAEAISSVLIVGGTGAISAGVEAQVESIIE